MSGATATSTTVVDQGNTRCARSPGWTTARNTTAIGRKPVGTATNAPDPASSAAFHAANDRIVPGRAPSDTSTSRSSRVSADDSANDIASTISAIHTTTRIMMRLNSSGVKVSGWVPDHTNEVDVAAAPVWPVNTRFSTS